MDIWLNLGIMGKKKDRLALIKQIIAEELISSQEELIGHLAKRGVHSTQSTLSRDFKEINISKIPHPERGYIYVSAEHLTPHVEVTPSNFGDIVLGVKFSANICVIATKSGYANAVGVVVDNHKSADILGSVAGDNTIILVLREGTEHKSVFETLCKLFPSLKKA